MNGDVVFRFTPMEVFTPAATRPLHWTPLDAMVRMLLAMAATPALLWRDGFSNAFHAHSFLRQLREAEALVRRLLLRDALALAASLARRPAHKAGKAGAAHAQTLTSDYRRWRVSVRLIPLRSGSGRASGAAPPSKSALEFLRLMTPVGAPAWEPEAPKMPRADPRRSALRFEAIRRIVENPEPFALRLARRLTAPKGLTLEAKLRRIFGVPESDPDDSSAEDLRPAPRNTS